MSEITLLHGDCLELMRGIPDNSVDMVLCDLPYGTTASKWDRVIPFDLLWEQYERIIKDRRAIVLFGAEPFSSRLRMSKPEWFKYDWIWEKNCPVGFVNAKNKPLNKHEVISVFSNGNTANCNKRNMLYNPQGLVPYNKIVKGCRKGGQYESTYGRPSNKEKILQEWTNYPTTVLHFQKVNMAVHPTQKPVALYVWTLQKFAKPGWKILDTHVGSGSSRIAAYGLGFDFWGCEIDKKYFDAMNERFERECLGIERYGDKIIQQPSLFEL